MDTVDHSSEARRNRSWVFFAWLAAFYAAWAALMFGTGDWRLALERWPIAVAMAAGSYFAGSTPLGGGTVAFPILVILFDQPAALARNFSFAVQSVGMVSATIYAVSRDRRMAWRFLGWAMAGALVSTPLCAVFLAPLASGLGAKLLFATIWASFGALHLARLREITGARGDGKISRGAAPLALVTGALGGAVASIIGVGAEMLVYMALVAALRTDLRIAIPTAVAAMAFTSIVGLATNLALGTVEAEVYANWLAAAPVVVVGAPIGALVVQLVARGPTLVIVSILCIGQFVWMCASEGVRGATLAVAIGAVVALSAVFIALFARRSAA